MITATGHYGSISTTITMALVLGPVEADYDVVISGNSEFYFSYSGSTVAAGYPSTPSDAYYSPNAGTQTVRLHPGDSLYGAGNLAVAAYPVSGSKGHLDFASTTFTATSANQTSTPVTVDTSEYGWLSGTLLVTVTASSFSGSAPVFNLLGVDTSGDTVSQAIQGQDGVSDPVSFASGFTGAFVAAQVVLSVLKYGLSVTLTSSGDSITYSAQLIGSGNPIQVL